MSHYLGALHVELSDDDLVMLFRQGHLEALELLFERYRWFTRAKARAYFLVGADRDDIEQEGLIGLFKAVRDYRPERESSFRAFAELCVTRQIMPAIVGSSERTGEMRACMAAMLSRLEVDVLNLYLQGRSYQDIGEELERHPKSIDNALQRIKRKLEAHLTEPEVVEVAPAVA